MVYLIHFEQKFKHAQHYRGATQLPLDERLMRHFNNNGSSLMKAVKQAGINWKLVRVWEGDFQREKQLKQTAAHRQCPVCQNKISYAESEQHALREAKNFESKDPPLGV